MFQAIGYITNLPNKTTCLLQDFCLATGQWDYSVVIITSPPEGVARYCFHPVCLSVCLCVCVSVCLSVCVSVCPANILVFYFSAIRRDIDLKFIQDTYMVVHNSLK